MNDFFAKKMHCAVEERLLKVQVSSNTLCLSNREFKKPGVYKPEVNKTRSLENRKFIKLGVYKTCERGEEALWLAGCCEMHFRIVMIDGGGEEQDSSISIHLHKVGPS